MAMNTLFSVGPGVFTDEEFARAVREISEPDLEGWEMFVETMGTTIYRKYKEVRPLCVCVHATGKVEIFFPLSSGVWTL